jgi:hypothetical protein
MTGLQEWPRRRRDHADAPVRADGPKRGAVGMALVLLFAASAHAATD